jgi:hypothetical protein
MFRKLFSITLLLLISKFQLHAQDKVPIKFGHVSPQDFDLSKQTVDTTQGAIIIAEQGYTSFKGNDKGWFSMVFEYKTRILITTKSGIGLANVEVPLFTNGDKKEQLGNVKAVTYNLEDGKVTETKLTNDAMFEEQYDKHFVRQKFTMPMVKVGSIIEYSYAITSDFLMNIHPWYFQGEYPKEWSEYETNIPEYFNYVTFVQGYLPFFIKTESNAADNYFIRVPEGRMVKLNGSTNDKRWVMKDVPVMEKEEFTTTTKNYSSKIEMQLSAVSIPSANIPYEDIMGSWVSATDQLLKNEYFGSELSRNNGWLNDSMKIIISGATDTIDIAKRIYYYVRNNFKSNNGMGIYLTNNHSLKEIFKNRSGSVAELNLLLTAMLRHEGISADPVILSTRANGNPQPLYPLISKYNYLVCQASVDTTLFYLDASKSYIGFGRLPAFCYNGPARVIDKDATPVAFLPDTLHEDKSTHIMLFNDSVVTGKWVGTVESDLSYSQSEKVREKIADKGIGEYKKEKQPFSEDFSFSNIEVKNLKECEIPVEVDCDVMFTPADTGAAFIYFNPIIKNWYKENPLKSAERKYPIEMPSLSDETYTLYLEIPAGYEVDELPKSSKVTFNGDEALFEYSIFKDETDINLKAHLKFSKATFQPEEYQDLRSFFDYIVKKNSEQIVFKKKK